MYCTVKAAWQDKLDNLGFQYCGGRQRLCGSVYPLAQGLWISWIFWADFQQEQQWVISSFSPLKFLGCKVGSAWLCLRPYLTMPEMSCPALISDLEREVNKAYPQMNCCHSTIILIPACTNKSQLKRDEGPLKQLNDHWPFEEIQYEEQIITLK